MNEDTAKVVRYVVAVTALVALSGFALNLILGVLAAVIGFVAALATSPVVWVIVAAGTYWMARNYPDILETGHQRVGEVVGRMTDRLAVFASARAENARIKTVERS